MNACQGSVVPPARLRLAHNLHDVPCACREAVPLPPEGLVQAVSPAGLLPFTLGQVYQVISPYTNKLDNVVELHSKIVAPTLPGAPQRVPVVCSTWDSCPPSCEVARPHRPLLEACCKLAS